MKHLYVNINLAIIGLAAALFGYWYFIDGTIINVPLTEMTDPMSLSTTKSSYMPGEEITIYNSFCKNVALPAEISTRMIDGQIISMAPRTSNLPVGCYGIDKPFTTTGITVPKVISPGVWYLEWEVAFQVNPIKTVTYKRKTKSFNIETPDLPI